MKYLPIKLLEKMTHKNYNLEKFYKFLLTLENDHIEVDYNFLEKDYIQDNLVIYIFLNTNRNFIYQRILSV